MFEKIKPHLLSIIIICMVFAATISLSFKNQKLEGENAVLRSSGVDSGPVYCRIIAEDGQVRGIAARRGDTELSCQLSGQYEAKCE